MAEKEKINPVTLDIVKDSLIAVSNEIFYAFAQTSMSPIIYETLDYASGIADAEGRLLTQGNGVTGTEAEKKQVVKNSQDYMVQYVR